MNYITQLKEMNVKFVRISENEALKIMSTEFPYYKLLEYASAFERYKSQPRAGQFVNLDFAELYYLALIDSKLSQIMMNVCLEVERFIKATFIHDVDSVGDTQKLLDEYYNSDREYLERNYTSEYYEILKVKYDVANLSTLDFYQFVDTVQFGTLERMMHFFYKVHAMAIYHSEFAPFEKYLSSLRRIRNAAAHNNSLLGQLDVKGENKALEVSAFLGRNGVKSRMLRTNMSKVVICDLCNVLFLYYKHVPGDKTETTEYFRNMNLEYCQKYADVFKGNDTLKSVYDFLVTVLNIFSETFKKVKISVDN